MTATVDDFRTRFPELAPVSVTDPTIQLYLDEAAEVVNLSACPTLADLMQLYYAAHELAKSGNNPKGQSESVGPMTSASVGQISQSFQAAGSIPGADSKAYFGSTVYGAKYLTLQKKCFGGAATVVP